MLQIRINIFLLNGTLDFWSQFLKFNHNTRHSALKVANFTLLYPNISVRKSSKLCQFVNCQRKRTNLMHTVKNETFSCMLPTKGSVLWLSINLNLFLENKAPPPLIFWIYSRFWNKSSHLSPEQSFPSGQGQSVVDTPAWGWHGPDSACSWCPWSRSPRIRTGDSARRARSRPGSRRPAGWPPPAGPPAPSPGTARFHTPEKQGFADPDMGSRIRDPEPGFGNRDRDPGWEKSGSGMNSPDHFSKSLETIFRIKNT